jgi:phosphoserine aminotransferase
MLPKKSKLVHNFSSGPSILPAEVMEEAAKGVIEYEDCGLSILEMSHRSPEFIGVMEGAKSLVRELLNVPSDFEILFVQGGASTQFTMVVQNLLPVNGTAAYVNTGTWSTKAIKEAQLFGDVKEIASSADKNFSYIPKGYEIPEDASYLHITSNNTIFGTQFHEFPKTNVPLVADMSSDIFSKPIDFTPFDLIYAGVQKNLGPAGAVLVIVKKSALGKTSRVIPTMLKYQTHIDKESMFNTPPCFPIYVSKLTLEWLKAKGGIPAIQEINKRKAQKLYDEIDRNSLTKGTAAIEDRSEMNVCFVLNDASLDAQLLEMAKEANISGIKGHRSVGGFRASIYNAMPEESINALIDLLQRFEEKYK